MAESQKGMPSIKPKEKSSLLDEKIGKEFLSSWKSMSLTEDDAMDFSFDTVPKGQKKKFNFEKLDVDFNLDGDFDKLSSFKVDMSDLDFLSPPSKTTKPMERCEEESSGGNRPIKQDDFNFSFDFNELDGFSFESSLTKEDKNSNTSDSKGVTPELSLSQGSKISLTEVNAGCDDCLDMKLPACKSVSISEVENLIGGQGDLNFINDGSASKSATSEDLVESHGGGISSRKAIIMSARETDQQKIIPANSTFAGPYAQQLKPDLPVQPVHANDSNLDTVSEAETKICSLGTKENDSSSGEKIDVDKVTTIVGSDHEYSPRKNSPPVHITGSDSNDSERNKSGGNALFKHMNDNEPAEPAEPAEPVEGDLDIKDTSTKNASRKMAYDTKGIIENQRSTSKLPLAPLGREHVIDTRPLAKEKGGIYSMFYTRPEETGSQLHQTPRTEFPSFGSKRVGAMHLCPASDKGESFKTNDAQNGCKSVGTTISVAKESTKGQPFLLRSEKNNKNLGKIRGGLDSDNVPNGSKLIEISQPHDKEVTKGELVLLGSEKNVKGHQTSRESFKTNDAQNGCKSVGATISVAKELTKGQPFLLRSEKNNKNLGKIRGGLDSDNVPNGSKLIEISQPHDKEVTKGELVLLGSEKNVKGHQTSRESFKTNDAQNGCKSVGTTISVANELTKGQPFLLISEKNNKNLGKIRGGLDSDNVPNGSKLIEISQPHDKEVTKGELVLLGSEKNVKGHQTSRGGLDSDNVPNGSKLIENSQPHYKELTKGELVLLGSEKNVKDHQTSSAQTSVNPKHMLLSIESLRNSEIIPAERNKICLIKSGKKTPDLSKMRTARYVGASKALSNSISQRQVNSSGNFKQNMGVQGNTASNIERLVDSNEKQMSQALSLKRKKIEASNADSESLKPLKRLYESPSESSNLKVPLERVLEEQVCIRGIRAEINAKHITDDQPTFGLESPREVNMMELEIPFVMETDGNVEKAQAYTKELDDICNILKKKHEEAKEILVRAIVSNNNLLMLNHPIYEEKIRKIQNFAAQLLSKELRT